MCARELGEQGEKTQSSATDRRRREQRRKKAVTRTETSTTKTSYLLRVLAVLVALAVAVSALAQSAGPGEKIAFASDRTGNDEVYVMDALDGSRQQNRTHNGATDWVPDWGVRVR